MPSGSSGAFDPYAAATLSAPFVLCNEGLELRVVADWIEAGDLGSILHGTRSGRCKVAIELCDGAIDFLSAGKKLSRGEVPIDRLHEGRTLDIGDQSLRVLDRRAPIAEV